MIIILTLVFVIVAGLIVCIIYSYFYNKDFERRVKEDFKIDYSAGLEANLDNSGSCDYIYIYCFKWQKNKAQHIEKIMVEGEIMTYRNASYKVKSVNSYNKILGTDKYGNYRYSDTEITYRAKVELYEDNMRTVTNNFNNNHITGDINIDQSVNNNETIYNLFDDLLISENHIDPDDWNYLELFKYKLKANEVVQADVESVIDKLNKYVPTVSAATSLINMLINFVIK
ncbi:hypothetical protein [Listeria booriae]|uniref:hypothetical protein n=1 Tax=Listeria booriae TaxID=1552123 RepID=UPI00162956F2|nr:hypothetical protein [Listeria booriae]MBC2148861.1 hypothetical protein [Listeria booriae]